MRQQKDGITGAAWGVLIQRDLLHEKTADMYTKQSCEPLRGFHEITVPSFQCKKKAIMCNYLHFSIRFTIASHLLFSSWHFIDSLMMITVHYNDKTVCLISCTKLLTQFSGIEVGDVRFIPYTLKMLYTDLMKSVLVDTFPLPRQSFYLTGETYQRVLDKKHYCCTDVLWTWSQ